jgi:hypothetical protein
VKKTTCFVPLRWTRVNVRLCENSQTSKIFLPHGIGRM